MHILTTWNVILSSEINRSKHDPISVQLQQFSSYLRLIYFTYGIILSLTCMNANTDEEILPEEGMTEEMSTL